MGRRGAVEPPQIVVEAPTDSNRNAEAWLAVAAARTNWNHKFQEWRRQEPETNPRDKMPEQPASKVAVASFRWPENYELALTHRPGEDGEPTEAWADLDFAANSHRSATDSPKRLHLRYSSEQLVVSPNPAAKLSATTLRWLLTQPLWTLNEDTEDESLAVTISKAHTSDVVCRLHRGTPLRVLATSSLANGITRACVVLDGHSSVLGWLSNGALRHIWPRPLYVARRGITLKVRRTADKSSRFVTQLDGHVRFHVVETRVNPHDGNQRVCVVVEGDEQPKGWVTSRQTRLGHSMIRALPEVSGDGSGGGGGGGGVGAGEGTVRGGLRSSRSSTRGIDLSWSPSVPDASLSTDRYMAARLEVVPPTGSPPTGSPLSSPEHGAATQRSALERSNERASATQRTAVGVAYYSSVSPQFMGVTHRSNGSPREPPPGQMRSPSRRRPRLSDEAVGSDGAAPVARAVAGFSGGDSLSSNKPGPGTKVKEVAASPIGTPSLIRSGAKEADKARPEHAGAISSADVAAAAKDLERQAEAEEARIEGKKTLAASVGAALKEKSSKFKDTATFLTATMKEWDPNRDGSISKMEFRQNVRNLVAKADVKESDSLFESLDTEKKGELDTDAVKKALRKLFDAADKFGGNADAIRASAERLRQRAAIVAEAAELTAAWERATAEHEQVKRESIGVDHLPLASSCPSTALH